MNEHTKISVVIPTYNHLKGLITCLDSLSKQDYQNYEAIVVTEPDCKETIEFIQDHWLSEKCRLVVNLIRMGCLRSCNIGIVSASQCSDIMNAGDDIVFRKDSLSQAESWLTKFSPDHDAWLAFDQATNKPYMVGGFSLMGYKFLERFKDRKPFCEDYNHINADLELKHYALSVQKFVFNPFAIIRHNQSEESLVRYSDEKSKQDNETFAKRKSLGYLWGKDSNRLYPYKVF